MLVSGRQASRSSIGEGPAAGKPQENNRSRTTIGAGELQEQFNRSNRSRIAIGAGEKGFTPFLKCHLHKVH